MKKVNVRLKVRELRILRKIIEELEYPSLSFFIRESIRFYLAVGEEREHPDYLLSN